MATSGEKRWPPMGNFVATTGEKPMAIDTARGNRIAAMGGDPPVERPSRRRRRGRSAGVRRTLRALGRLVLAPANRARPDADAGARDGALRRPGAELLPARPGVNFVPELPLGDEDPLGRHALRFTGEHAGSGWPFELVALADGGAFDLLGMSG